MRGWLHYDALGRLDQHADAAQGTMLFTRTESPTGAEVTIESPLGRTKTYERSYLKDSIERRVNTLPTGHTITSAKATDGGRRSREGGGARRLRHSKLRRLLQIRAIGLQAGRTHALVPFVLSCDCSSAAVPAIPTGRSCGDPEAIVASRFPMRPRRQMLPSTLSVQVSLGPQTSPLT